MRLDKQTQEAINALSKNEIPQAQAVLEVTEVSAPIVAEQPKKVNKVKKAKKPKVEEEVNLLDMTATPVAAVVVAEAEPPVVAEPIVAAESKPKRKISEEHKAALKAGRDKWMANKKAAAEASYASDSSASPASIEELIFPPTH